MTVLPMGEVFSAACAVLSEAMRPMHYRELTAAAVHRLGITTPIDMTRQIEDVREKLLAAGGHGSGYIGDPHCLGFLRRWFRSKQEDLFNSDHVLIRGSVTAGCRAVREGIMRAPRMVKKNPHASDDAVAIGRARGLVVEAHVLEFFEQHWPGFYQPAANHGRWSEPCSHDFRLALGGKPIEVDVWGVARDGSYRAPPMKHPTTLHLQCRPGGQDVIWEGVAGIEEYSDRTLPALMRSPVRMCVWLNCLQAGLPYNKIVAAASKAR